MATTTVRKPIKVAPVGTVRATEVGKIIPGRVTAPVAAAASTPIKPTTIQQDLTPKAYETYQQRLAGVGTSAKQDEILASQARQKTEMAAAKTPEARQQVYEQNLQGRKATMLEALQRNPNVSQEYLNLFQNKWNPMTGKIEGATDAEWAAIPDRFKRDIEVEQETAGKYGTTGDTANMNLAAYDPDKLAGLIETGQVDPNQFTAQQLADVGLTPDRLQHLVDAGYLRPELLQGLMQLGGQTGVLGSNLEATQKPTNSMMGILQESLAAKSGVGNQSLGVSALFKQAGLSGYSVLAQSLQQRSQEMQQKYDSMANMVQSTGGAMGDLYSQMADSYKASLDSFDKQMGRLLKIDEDVKDQENLMIKIDKDQQNAKDLAYYKYELEVKLKEAEARINPKTTNSTPDIYSTGKNKVVVLDQKTGEYREISEIESKIGGKVYNKNVVAKVLGVGGDASWCGVFASTISTAPKVGDTWQEKKTKITSRDNPTAGDKLLIPLSVQTDGTGFGHVATVLDYDDSTGNIWVVESNRDGRMNRGAATSKVTFGVYNLNELQRQYGDNFGFADGELKQSVQDSLAATGTMETAQVDDSWKRKQGETVGIDQYLQFFRGAGIGSTLKDIMIAGTQSIPIKTPAERYMDITGDESVLVRDGKTGKPVYQQGKELEAMLSGKSSKEIDQYFTKLQQAQEEKAKGKVPEPLGLVVTEAKALAQEYGGDPDAVKKVYQNIKESYGTEQANKLYVYFESKGIFK